VLGLTWTLILRYEMSQFGENEARLLAWVKELCAAFEVSFEGGWSHGFGDGKVSVMQSGDRRSNGWARGRGELSSQSKGVRSESCSVASRRRRPSL
jgi:hypothetical protein